jgi:hypothetical protein
MVGQETSSFILMTKRLPAFSFSFFLDSSLVKAYEVLTKLASQFEQVLAAEDIPDGAALEAILKNMAKESAMTRWLVHSLTPTAEAQ